MITKKTKQAKVIKFKGWDWTELLAIWNEPLPKDRDEEQLALKFIRKRVDRLSQTLFLNEQSDKEAYEVNQIRKFLHTAAAHQHGYDHEIWQAIADCKSDWTMLWYVDTCLEAFWT